MTTFSEMVMKVLSTEKTYEPVKRNKDGLKYVGHRFPIKGGISAAEVLARNIAEFNPLFDKLKRG